MKKYILITILLMLAANLFGQNPSNYYRWIKTSNDTVTIGLAGNKILTVKNLSVASGDTISVYIPFTDGTYSGYPFKIGRQVSREFAYYGSKFILKSNVDSVMINYSLGDVSMQYDPSVQYINTLNYKDTLKAGAISVSRLFNEQYPRVEISIKYDSVSVGNDTLRLKHIGIAGDTTPVYVLDTLTGARQSYIVNVGDKQYHSFRVDKWCPNILIFEYADAVIYSTKFMINSRGVNAR